VGTVLGYLAGLTALGTAVDAFLNKLTDASQLRLIILGAVTLGLGLAWRLVRKRMGPTSSFTSPAKLKIGQRYLYGREDEVRILSDRLKDYPLVFLVGESGAGKSSLLEKGLVPKLKESPFTLPIYLNHWGADWIEGPRRTLADALSQTLDAGLRERLGLKGPLGVDQLFPTLARLHDDLGLSPVLLLDQFDDYQTRHREQFLRGPDRKLLRAPDLVRDNPFWKEFAELLEAGKLHCVVATRDDAQWGLESVRFQEPGFYLLPLLEREHAAAVLDAVAVEAGVIEPERGFRQLHDRLLLDLAPEGLVLPIQLKSVLQGLAELRPLNVAGYTREGGLSGLEALSIARAIAQAARTASWKPELVRGLLLVMVDPVSRQKTVPATVQQLLEAVPPESRDETKLSGVLSSLRDEDIVRDRVDRDLGTSVWQLDHDYLCRGVLELDRRARRWPLLLQESAQSFAAARGLRAWWAALLKPTVQMRLLWERLRGRLIYGSARRYAGLSVLRFVGNVWVPLAVLGLFAAVAYPVWKAERLLEVFRDKDNLNTEEARALWDLSGELVSVRHAFLDEVFNNQSKAERFNKHGSVILRATVGLNESLANRLLPAVLIAHCSRPHREDYFKQPCRSVAENLPPTPENAATFFKAWKENSDFAGVLSQIPSLLDKLSAGSSSSAAADLVKRIEREEDVDRLAQMIDDLMALHEKLPPPIAESAAGRLVGAVEAGGFNFDKQEEILRRIISLAPSIARPGAKKLLSRLRSIRFLQPMDEAIVALGERPAPKFMSTDQENRKIAIVQFDSIQGKLRRCSDITIVERQRLQEFFLSIGDLPLDKQLAFAEQLGHCPFGVVYRLGFSGEHLSPEVAAAFADVFLKFSQEDSSDGSALLSSRLFYRLTENISEPAAKEVSQRLLSRLLQEKEPEVVEAFASVLGSLGSSLPTADAEKAANYIMGLLEVETSSSARTTLVMALVSLGHKIPQAVADDAARRVLAWLRNAKSGSLGDWGNILSGLGESLSAPVQREALGWILGFSRQQANPPCAAAASLVRSDDETLRQVVDLLKWPTCSVEGREMLVKSLEKVVGGKFRQGNSELVDIWAVARWAEKKGLRPAEPPLAPAMLSEKGEGKKKTGPSGHSSAGGPRNKKAALLSF